MPKSLLIIFLFTISTNGFGHETNKAFFEILHQDSIIEVHCEFPWTIRNSLMAFDTSLEYAKNKKDFEKAFYKYIKKNLILSNAKGENLELLGFTEIKKNNHFHAHNYLITFMGTDIKTLKNTIMFNVFNHQENYHTYKSDNRDFSFSTENDTPTVNLNEKELEFSMLWVLLGLITTITLTLKLAKIKIF